MDYKAISLYQFCVTLKPGPEGCKLFFFSLYFKIFYYFISTTHNIMQMHEYIQVGIRLASSTILEVRLISDSEMKKSEIFVDYGFSWCDNHIQVT